MRPVERINDSVLGPIEQPALAWMVRRLPQRILPDHLTAAGVVGALLTAAGFVLARGSLLWLWLASFGLILNWAGDSLDGTLARLRHIERPRYGFFIDHTSDLFSQVITFLSLGVSPLAHFGVACLGLIAFLMAFLYTLINALTRGIMRVTYFHFGPTEIRVLLLGGNLLTLAVGVIDLPKWLAPVPAWGSITIHDFFIALISLAGMVLISV
ncbi:MAG TPA: CDP-alcohol phosphatidyltransferase family protein, partial [Steroidobacteraceae bacterium]